MRKRARDESTSINVIYDDQLQVLSQGENSADVLAQLPSLESIRSCLYRSRHEHTPTLPIHRRDVSLSGRYTKTCSGEDFLLVDDGNDNKIMIFATEENLQLMSEADAFFIDGTFSTCPSLFLSGISCSIVAILMKISSQRFRAMGLELPLVKEDFVLRKRRKGYRLFLIALMLET